MAPASLIPDASLAEAAGEGVPSSGEAQAGSGSMDRAVLAQTLAFLGNSLLGPMEHDAAFGLDPAFWEVFPADRENALVDEALGSLARWAHGQGSLEPDAALDRVNTEYARLFIGPPRPAAAPWQTMYAGEETHVGMGRPAFQMKQRLREAGMELRCAGQQYEDHIGLELLLASVYVEREAAGSLEAGTACSFAQDCPLAWIGLLRERAAAAAPEGYYALLLQLAHGVLQTV